MANVSEPDSRATDYETIERRYTLAVNLECWELLAMHSIANDESIPRIRLRMLKAFAGLPTSDNCGGGASPSPSTRKRVAREANPRRS
ncbi:hypothetical protein K440DRAFT_594669 [Wilcoxina mikolae CBS 423.85]|nr:hypothetical protein K440DRAFT_594669 [Wilcoxina mikolae CBS 423.85]